MATKGRFDIGDEVALGGIVRLLDVARHWLKAGRLWNERRGLGGVHH